MLTAEFIMSIITSSNLWIICCYRKCALRLSMDHKDVFIDLKIVTQVGMNSCRINWFWNKCQPKFTTECLNNRKENNDQIFLSFFSQKCRLSRSLTFPSFCYWHLCLTSHYTTVRTWGFLGQTLSLLLLKAWKKRHHVAVWHILSTLHKWFIERVFFPTAILTELFDKVSRLKVPQPQNAAVLVRKFK